MKRLAGAVIAVVILMVYASTGRGAAASIETRDLSGYFAEFPAATFVLYDEADGKYLIYNEAQGNKRLSPCSTFKIYNSLAGLEAGVVDREDEKTLLRWDGTAYDIPAWNRDQTLATATRDSVVWYFQDLAARIGAERLQAFLEKIGYGNEDISGGLTTFWLGSSLAISAREQVDLLARLYSGALPVAAENVEVVKRNITLSDSDGIRFMGKTGSGMRDGQWILGWFVGCVERAGRRYFFATNIEAPRDVNGPKAKEITRSILRDLKIL